MWFAVFDYEFEKDRKVLTKNNSFQDGDENLLMRNPELYRIGMEHKCFGKT